MSTRLNEIKEPTISDNRNLTDYNYTMSNFSYNTSTNNTIVYNAASIDTENLN